VASVPRSCSWQAGGRSDLVRVRVRLRLRLGLRLRLRARSCSWEA